MDYIPLDKDYIHKIPAEEYSRFNPQAYWIAVIGSRSFTDEKTIYTNLEYLINKMVEFNEVNEFKDVIIISGKAKGVDSIARQFALDNKLTVVNIIPDWKKYGKSAGMKRNPHIIKNADRVLAFRKNKSKGTTFGIEYAESIGLPCHVIDI